MEAATVRIDLVSAAVAGLRFGFDVALPADEGRHPASFPARAAVDAFAGSLFSSASDAAAAFSSLGRLPQGDLMVSSVTVGADAMAARRFDVPMPDGTSVSADARHFSDASLVAAARFAFEGKTFSHLLAGPEVIASSLDAVRTSARQPSVEGKHCSLDLRDWRVSEGEGDSLTEAQSEPFAFSLVSGGYGPAALFRKGDEQYSVSMEVDEGCVSVHVQGPASDNSIATVRISREAMQVSLSADDGQSWGAVASDTLERVPGDFKLTQDGHAATAPSA